ncbi:hypothetical protein [Pseudaestuariivita rosea]|uniref:hypothetical protein n=1 Tax=Pseudaestuariivita rosea TaxID=2763263 RepID=UPI001ABB2BD7|nr:hypothetical protein [Pseudaestuariivita rosea]
MWGMPPLAGQPGKLGCGTLSHEVADPTAPSSPTEIGTKIIEAYVKHYSAFVELFDSRVAFNHWTRLNCASEFVRERNVYIVTSDNGAGFKFAPLVAARLSKVL